MYLTDPPREGIEDVVKKCRGAGIRVFMVTGDYALTAAAIATQIGIFTVPQYDTVEVMRLRAKEKQDFDGDRTDGPNQPGFNKKQAILLTGHDIELMDNQDWREVCLYEEIVFARTTPEQKLRIVKEFQHDGHIVGVTGDGVNDAPALKSANIGIAMGSGSEVAMEVSYLIFNSLPRELSTVLNSLFHK